MRSRTLTFSSAAAAAAIAAIACTNEVPIGAGHAGSSGAAGSAGAAVGGSGGSGTGGSAGSVGGSAGTGASGSGGSVGGSAGVGAGGSGAIGGSSGSGSGGSATGGGSSSCPSDDSQVTQKIPALGVRDVLAAEALYWSISAPNGSIQRLTTPSGTPEEFASAAKYPAQSAAFENPDSLAHDGSYLYWRTKEGRSIWRAPISGASAPAEIATVSAFSNGSTSGAHDALSVANDRVYWVQGGNPVGGQTSFSIYSAPKAGGASTELKSYVSSATADQPFHPLSLAVDASSLYVGLIASPGSSKLVKMGTDGSNPTDHFGIGHHVLELSSSVFMTAAGAVWRIPKTGGSPAVVTMGLNDTSGYLGFSHGISEYAGTLYVSSHGTIGTLPCCECGWVFSVGAAITNGAIAPLWSGKGWPLAISVSPGFSGLAFSDIDNHQVVVIDLQL